MKRPEKVKEALSRLCAHAWGDTSKPVFSIPPRPEVDADCIVYDYISHLESLASPEARRELAVAAFRAGTEWSAGAYWEAKITPPKEAALAAFLKEHGI